MGWAGEAPNRGAARIIYACDAGLGFGAGLVMLQQPANALRDQLKMAQLFVISHQDRDFVSITTAQAIISVYVHHLKPHIMPGQQGSQFDQHLVAQMALPAAIYSKRDFAHGA
jgi:hypothetical protein